jgi:hypothetical protein
MEERVFGDAEWVSCWRLKWSPTPEELLAVIDRLIAFIGMTTDGDPDIRIFPNAEGKGGTGCQIYRALTESYVIAGTWTELGITRIMLSSCKLYKNRTATVFLKKQTGASILKSGFYEY